MEGQVEPSVALESPPPKSPAVETVAEVWHTVVLLLIIGVWFYFGNLRIQHLRLNPGFSHITHYIFMILWDSAVVGFVAWGVHRRGGSLRMLTGGRWNSAKNVFVDLGVAASFWFASIFVLGFLRLALSSLETSPAARIAQTVQSPQGSRGFQVPHSLDFLAPRNGGEILAWIALCIVIGFSEELIFRGYLQRQLSAWTNVPIGLILSAVLFGVGHRYQGKVSSVVLGVYGLFFGILAEKRKSLRPGMLAHAWHDTISGLIVSLLRHFR